MDMSGVERQGFVHQVPLFGAGHSQHEPQHGAHGVGFAAHIAGAAPADEIGKVLMVAAMGCYLCCVPMSIAQTDAQTLFPLFVLLYGRVAAHPSHLKIAFPDPGRLRHFVLKFYFLLVSSLNTLMIDVSYAVFLWHFM